MSTTYQPVVSDVADLYWWKTTNTLTTNVVGTAGQFATNQVKTKPDSVFCFVAWRGASNYDSIVQLRASIGAGPAAATGLYACLVPNNFEVEVKRNNRFDMMDQPMPQAAICSNGYRAGQQVPIPIIYPPSTMFNFTVFNTAEKLFLDAAGVAINLRVDFGLFGYNIQVSKLPTFLGAWPELYGLAMQNLTGIQMPRL